MTNTGFYELDTDPPNLANGFMDGPNGSRLDNIFTLSVKGSPYGDAYSTGPDMDKFHRALTSHKLLGESSLKMLWTGVTENPDTHKEYGFGAYIERYNGQVVISHGGGWKGVTDEFELFPELGYSVVVLSNIDDDPTAIAYKLREWLTQGASNEVPAETPPLDLKAEVSVAATGVVGTPITVTVTVRNDGGTAHASVVNMEIHDLNGAKADQQFNMDQKIETHEAKTYSYKWIPKASGRYTINVGLFGPGWVPKYRQYPAIAEVVVK